MWDWGCWARQRFRLGGCRELRKQRSLFATDSCRYRGFYADQPGDTAQLDRIMGSHADVEDAIFWLKHSGMSPMPFTDRHPNSAWAALAAVSLTLVGCFQACCLSATLANTALKRLRWQLWHLPAIVSRTARHVLRWLREQNPGAEALRAIAHPR